MYYKYNRKLIFVTLIQLCFNSTSSQNVYKDYIIEAFPMNLLEYEYRSINDSNFSSFNGIRPMLVKNNSKYFDISIISHAAINDGHPNIDNSSEFYALKGLNRMNTMRFVYGNKWLFFTLEPQIMHHQNLESSYTKSPDSFSYLNSRNINDRGGITKSGFRRSGLLLQYGGIGLGYTNMSNWWGPGLHSSISLTSNSSGFYSYIFGTFRDIQYKNIGFGFRMMVAEIGERDKMPFYLSGLVGWLNFHTEPHITLGLSRQYLSGGINNLSQETSLNRGWTIKDAANLIFEPLFSQDKNNDYIIANTPGFDYWDQTLTGFIELTFKSPLLKLYFEISSDDNRGNFTDLKAHWDHSLGYLLGFRKYYKINNNKFVIGSEYLSTKNSNSFKFRRVSIAQLNYYSKDIYNFSTYEGRRLGAHSGSDSDDFIIFAGIKFPKQSITLFFNIERHGIKSQIVPEFKKEIMFVFSYDLNNYHSIFINFEYETIDNYNFSTNYFSTSKLFWLGYSISFH